MMKAYSRRMFRTGEKIIKLHEELKANPTDTVKEIPKFL